jgi:ADP-heptose:LPS heptosyltransferase
MYTTRVARPRGIRPRHAVANQWDLLLTLGIAAPDPVRTPAEMPTDELAVSRISERLTALGAGPDDPLIVLHVSAGNPFRRWPQSSFAELAAALVSRHAGVRVIVVSGPSERDAAAHVVESARAALSPDSPRCGRDRVLFLGDTSLAELRALLDRAALFIGGDSGPLHIAATTRTPIVGLYGPTLPVRSAPWRSPALTTESVEGGPLPCRPCDQRVCVPGDFRCLTRITPDAVVAAAERALCSTVPQAPR